MGCVSSRQTKPVQGVEAASSSQKTNTVIFKVLPSESEARRKFEGDGTLIKNSDAGHLALRTMLDEPLSQNCLGKFAAKTQVLDIFMCWVDIQEFKTIPTESYRRSKALHIYHKYIKDDAPLMVGVTTMQERQRFEDDIYLSKTDPSIITSSFYDGIQSKCFLDMYYNIFLPFKQTEEFQQLTVQIKNKYNRVKISDFEYFTKLGEGGFGFVVHCKKKSTGKHFAMKIQTKLGLLECYKDDMIKVNMEKDAFASIQHPFVVNLYYAFQTPSLALMVLDLADCGDLNGCVMAAPNMRLPEDRVRFYTAEIVLALAYLHQRGLIYRDLKPQNVLLNADGHVQLVDLGGVMDDQGIWSEKHRPSHSPVVPLFSRSKKHNHQKTVELDENGQPIIDSEEQEKDQDEIISFKTKPKRRQSIMGTLGYMAPEMVLMLNRPMYGEHHHHERNATKQILRKGYTQAVDWWSLGVTVFKLLTGQRPFNDKQMYAFVDLASTLHEAVGENINFKEYAMLFQKVTFPPYISEVAQSLISGLLDVNDKSRLGHGPDGVLDIKKHPFFNDIDWDMLEQKQIEPPFKPNSNSLQDSTNLVGTDLRALLSSYGKEHYLDDVPSEADQRYFETWDFISPQTLRIEAGLSQMMGQLVKNMKARKIMGDENNQPRKAEKLENSSQSNNILPSFLPKF